MEPIIELQKEAILRLENSCAIDTDHCLVDGTKVTIFEKDGMLQQLRNGDYDLRMPMALFFTSSFWRRLKALSNEKRDASITHNE